MRIRLPLLLGVPALALALAACGTAAGTEVTGTSDLEINVEVDVMSGVPNPTWTVRGDDAAALATMVGELPDGGVAESGDGPGLGFRGFVLRGLELAEDGTESEVRVLGDTVVVSTGTGAGAVRLDEDGTVFAKLRSMSEQHLDENILQAIPVDGLKGSR